MLQRNSIKDKIFETNTILALLNNTIDEKSNFVITDQDGRTLKNSNIETNDDGKIEIKLDFIGSNKTNTTDDFDFEEMRKERERYIENLANDSYENICNIIRTSNKNGRNDAMYIFDNDKYNDTVIDTIIEKLSSKGFNVKKNDEGVLHKTYARIIITWS